MPHLILAFDHDEMEDLRESLREDHRCHLKSIGKKLLASGALLSDDGNTIIGGMSIIDIEDHTEAKKFADTDPYAIAGIRKETQIIRWRNRWWNGEFLGDKIT